MTRKKLMSAAFISGVIIFFAGFLHNLIIEGFNFKYIGESLIISLLAATVVLLVLRIYSRIVKILQIENCYYKPYLYIAAAAFLICAVALIILFMDKKSILVMIKNNGYLICYTYFFSCLVLILFLYGLDEKKPLVKPENFNCTKLKSQSNNKDNLPVTLSKITDPETYFDDPYGRELFETNQDFLQNSAEEEARDLILMNKLQNNTTGEWFLSRVDFNCKNTDDEPLYYQMTFIQRIKTEVSVNGLHVTDKFEEHEYCRIICSFDYNSENEGRPFSFSDLEIEFV